MYSGANLEGPYIMVLLYMSVSVAPYDYIVIGKPNVETILIMLSGRYALRSWRFVCLDGTACLHSRWSRFMVKL